LHPPLAWTHFQGNLKRLQCSIIDFHSKEGSSLSHQGDRNIWMILWEALALNKYCLLKAFQSAAKVSLTHVNDPDIVVSTTD
jgi:hypothetical protein